MAKQKMVRVLAVTSFEGVRKGDEAVVAMTPRLKGIIATGYLRVVEDVGEIPGGPSTDSSRGSGGGAPGADVRVSGSGESSEDPDAGGYRTASVLDPYLSEVAGE